MLTQDFVLEIVRPVLTGLVGILVLVAFGFAFRRTIGDALVQRFEVKVPFFEFRIVRRQLDQAIDSAPAEVDKPGTEDRSLVLRRAQRLAALLQGARLLWIDDEPKGNASVLKILRGLGLGVDLAKTSAAAAELLAEVEYDVVVSDIGRGVGHESEGLDTWKEWVAPGSTVRVPWTIFYVRMLRGNEGVPKGALGLTNRPDHLLHFVMDAIERERS